MIRLADYPILQTLAAQKTQAERLDARSCKYLYASTNYPINAALLSAVERELFDLLQSI